LATRTAPTTPRRCGCVSSPLHASGHGLSRAVTPGTREPYCRHWTGGVCAAVLLRRSWVRVTVFRFTIITQGSAQPLTDTSAHHPQSTDRHLRPPPHSHGRRTRVAGRAARPRGPGLCAAAGAQPRVPPGMTMVTYSKRVMVVVGGGTCVHDGGVCLRNWRAQCRPTT